MDTQVWKQYIPEFREKTARFYEGTLSQKEYKGFSGFYGSYAQRGGKANMLRLRITAGRLTKDKMEFTVRMIRKYHIKRIHFTTCQTIQLHDLTPEAAASIMEEALDAGIITIGGGGDYPRNVMCPPLSGVQTGEYFDVLPFAEAAGSYMLRFIGAKKMPRKLKVCFSNSPDNVTHATYRDLGFVAVENGTFDVYSAGGLGASPRFGVKVGHEIPPDSCLYYIKAMWLTFLSYGNYESRARARTRYMQETLGGPEQYALAFREKLKEVYDSGEDLLIHIKNSGHWPGKQNNGAKISDNRVIEQKQAGLYTVEWHPIGGQPDPELFCKLSDTICAMEDVEVRLAPDETAYIINLTAEEAANVLDITSDSAKTLFETSVSCIGASICQVGARDSQALLSSCIRAVREASIPDGALPKIHISGCPSSCGTHQTGVIGFRGGVKKVNGKPEPAFVLYVNGSQRQGHESMGHEAGAILETEIPEFLVKLGKTVAQSGMDFAAWHDANPSGIDELAAEFTA